MSLLEQWNSCPVNVSAIAARLGITRNGMRARLKALEEEGLLYLLPLLGPGRKKLLYVRGGHGAWPASFRSFCADALITRIRAAFPESRFTWWETGRVRRIDLVAELGDRRIGFCFAEADEFCNRHWLPLRLAFLRGAIHRGYLLHMGDEELTVGLRITAVPLNVFLPQTRERCSLPDVDRPLDIWRRRRYYHTDRSVFLP